MAKEPKNRSSKPSERKSSKKEPTPQLDQGSEESKFRPRLRDIYEQQVVPTLMKEFGYGNANEVPRISKIVLNVGLGEAVSNPNLVKTAADETEETTFAVSTT